ncbi:MAG: diguanylate cyclase [Syntrophotaleaceae bacterium]
MRFTVSQKIAAGYLLIAFFSLAALIYALTALSRLTSQSEQLVAVEFKALGLMQDLARSLQDQERLERQVLILRDASMIPLLTRRNLESDEIWKRLQQIPRSGSMNGVANTYAAFRKAQGDIEVLLEDGRWQEAEQRSLEVIAPRREGLIRIMEVLRQSQENSMNEILQSLPMGIKDTYRLTFALAFAGVAFAGLVATGIILKIHRSVARLTGATKAIATGCFDYPLDIDGKDEFSRLAREFAEMGQKLRDLQKIHLDANPLTRLPGNLTIERELNDRITSGRPFAHIYIDLDYFKAYNDRYGYHSGSSIISRVGAMIQEIVRGLGNEGDLIGHVGGDDYVVLSTPNKAEAIAAELIRRFDLIVPEFYNEEDRNAGFFIEKDRYGEERRFPLLSMSIAIVCTDNLRKPTAEAIGRECAKIKEHLKKLPGSNYLLDRRERR